MFGRVLTFVVGVYVGVYLDQNYTIPRVDDPNALIERIKEFTSKYKKED